MACCLTELLMTDSHKNLLSQQNASGQTGVRARPRDAPPCLSASAGSSTAPQESRAGALHHAGNRGPTCCGGGGDFVSLKILPGVCQMCREMQQNRRIWRLTLPTLPLKERESTPPRAAHDGPSFGDRLTPQRASRKRSWEKKNLKTAAKPI